MTDHPSFKQPSPASCTIWRYLDFAKLVAMLEAGALYFSRVDQLKDPFEGSLSRAEFERWEGVARAAEEYPNRLPVEWRGHYFDILMQNARRARRSMFVNCWHQSESESEAMWRLYGRSGYSIALKSTYATLVSVLPGRLHNGCYVGMVQYADHDTDPIPEGNAFTPIMYKRRAFAHEHEVRAVVWIHDGRPPLQTYPIDNPLGLDVPVALDQLIQRLVVSPEAPAWFGRTVERIAAHYLPGVSVVGSSLLAKPYL